MPYLRRVGMEERKNHKGKMKRRKERQEGNSEDQQESQDQHLLPWRWSSGSTLSGYVFQDPLLPPAAQPLAILFLISTFPRKKNREPPKLRSSVLQLSGLVETELGEDGAQPEQKLGLRVDFHSLSFSSLLTRTSLGGSLSPACPPPRHPLILNPGQLSSAPSTACQVAAELALSIKGSS